ncbi:MAG: FumA C-terminus/TtdB family hydratase beta subunit [Candidatus Edwardsbacteria bacterium]|jgi:fumarate hydratase subunit beta|nr:FumA C-terminus/TtdB family hydratase beta subunit [Candidatus Edwardsbacteria bacterium]
MPIVTLTTPLKTTALRQLHPGQEVLLSGTVYTARDAAHRRLAQLLDGRRPLPFDLRGAVIYYAGPTPAPKGRAIGSIGPTTSYRMDAYTPRLLAAGLAGMIGKGQRSPGVVAAIRKHRAAYFAALGGAGAYLSARIVSARVIAFPELGTEAVRQLEVRDFPLTVINDPSGGDFYLDVMKRSKACK